MPFHRCWKLVLPVLVLAACTDQADAPTNPELAGGADSREGVRFATFNASLNRASQGELIADLSNFNAITRGTTQAKNAAETIQRIRPDVVLINEFDFDADGTAGRLFQQNYLSRSINGSEPIKYPHRYVAESNTGIASGFDLNNNGFVVTTPGAPGYGDDAFGFGAFPGQFGMVVYSMYPIIQSEVRTFQKFLWNDMPGALLPDDAATAAPADWYSPAELAIFRLSSKSHWDLPLQIKGNLVHFLVSHPTPRCSMAPRIGTGSVTSTRSVFGPTISIRNGPATSMTTRDSAAGSSPARSLSLPVIRTRTLGWRQPARRDPAVDQRPTD